MHKPPQPKIEPKTQSKPNPGFHERGKRETTDYDIQVDNSSMSERNALKDPSGGIRGQTERLLKSITIKTEKLQSSDKGKKKITLTYKKINSIQLLNEKKGTEILNTFELILEKKGLFEEILKTILSFWNKQTVMNKYAISQSAMNIKDHSDMVMGLNHTFEYNQSALLVLEFWRDNLIEVLEKIQTCCEQKNEISNCIQVGEQADYLSGYFLDNIASTTEELRNLNDNLLNNYPKVARIFLNTSKKLLDIMSIWDKNITILKTNLSMLDRKMVRKPKDISEGENIDQQGETGNQSKLATEDLETPLLTALLASSEE